MAKKTLTYSDLVKLAERYGVDDNVMFVSASNRYLQQVDIIEKMKARIDDDGLMIERINVKGDVNMDTHPLAAQLPKYLETANKTMTQMLDIIQKLGREKQVERFGDMDE